MMPITLDILRVLRELVEVESPTDDLAACRRVIDKANEITQRLIGTKAEVLKKKVVRFIG